MNQENLVSLWQRGPAPSSDLGPQREAAGPGQRCYLGQQLSDQAWQFTAVHWLHL